jgi:hypothetical protein
MKTVFFYICLVLLIAKAGAQPVTYDIISTTGSIVDKKTGKPLQVGDRVTMQTELQFNSLSDRAVVLNPEKTKYALELPKSSFVNSQLTVTSDEALSPVKSRPALATGVRGSSVMVTNGLSANTLKEYFAIDTFTIVGAKFTLPVRRQDARKYELLLRYEVGNVVEEYFSTDFSISKNDLTTEGNRISECFVLLKDGDTTIPVTQLSLFFVDKTQLFDEFNSLLRALNQPKNDKNKAREILRQYCTDVYGMIDRNTLESTINDFLALK